MFRSRGVVLLIVVGVLGILVVLSTAFVTLARLERKASEQRLCATQALLLARSGMEDALARISAGQDPLLPDSAYGGEDWNGDELLTPGLEQATQVYQPLVLDTASCPVRHALRPSFYVRDPSSGAGNPLEQMLDGRERGLSGHLSGHGYALKISPQGGVYVNGGTASGVPTYDATLRRMLGTLAKALDEEAGGIDGNPVGEADGWNLMDARPDGGWKTWGEIRQKALGNSQVKLEAFRPYLALRAWVDPKVIRPNASAGMIGAHPRSWGEIKTFGGRGAPVPEGRAPVNLAWARSHKPLLLALFSGLEGIYLDEREALQEASGGGAEDRVGLLNSVSWDNRWSTTDE